jgi:hypothetical protein
MGKHDEIDGIARAAFPLVVLIGCIGAAPAALAQSAPGVTVDVGDCVKLQTPEERLACFDAAVKKSGSAPAAAPPPAPSAPSAAQPTVAPPAAAAPPASSGAAAPAAAASSAAAASAAAQSSTPSAAPQSDHAGRATQSEESASAATIVAKVKSLKPTVPNAYQITLDNGQVWRQTYPQFYPMQPGTEVTLTPTRWGNAYRLSSDHLKGFIQVERVR